MNLTKIVMKRPVAVIICIMALLIFGLSSVFSMPMELTPDMEMPVSLVMTTYPGAGPEEVDEQVTKVIEDAVSTISGLEIVQSQSSENVSTVMMQFEYGTNMDLIHSDLKEKIDMYKSSLPEDASDPIVMEISMDMMPAITFSAEAVGDVDLLNYVNDNIVPEFERLTGVASVSVSGGEQDYIRVKLDPEKMTQHKLSMSSLSQLIASADFSYPAGNVDRGDQELILRGGVKYDTVEALRNLPITLGGGSIIHLSDVATVENTVMESGSISRYNGMDNVTLSVSKRQSAGTLNVTNDVIKTIDRLNGQNLGVQMDVIYNSGDEITSAINSVVMAMVSGAVLAMLILFIFLGDWKASVIIGTSIPVSILLTLVAMSFAGLTINLMSLGGLLVGVGMMVDNSIVVIESCFKLRDTQRSFWESALEGAKVVTSSIIASTLTSVVVYLPVSLLNGMSGQMFRQVGFTIIFALVASLISALTLVPLLFIKLHPVEKKETPVSRGMRALERVAGRGMAKAFRHKALVVMVSILLLIGSVMVLPVVGFELIPAMDQGAFSVSLETKPGLQLKQVDEILVKLEDIITSYDDVERYSLSGSSGSGSISVYLKGDRKMSTAQIVDEVREQTKDFVNCKVEVSSSSMMNSLTGGSGIQVNLQGSDLDVLRGAVSDVEALMWQNPNVITVSSGLSDGSPQAEVIVDPVKAAGYSLTPIQVMGTLSSAVQGSKATSLRMDGKSYDVRLEYPEGTYDSIADLEGMMITTPTGAQVALNEISHIEYSNSPQTLTRLDGQYLVTVTAQAKSATSAKTSNEIMQAVGRLQLPEGVTQSMGGSLDSMMKELTALLGALLTAVLLVFMVMAVQFESMRFSLVVMFSVPFAFIGSAFMLLVSGSAVSMVSMMGIIMLVGIVVNNGILLIDTAGRMQAEEGLSPEDSLVAAGRSRLRPILMTTLTTVLGMVPMALGIGSGTEMMQSMALIIIGGLITSTILTIFLLPTIYLLFRKKNKGEKERKKQEKQEKKAKKHSKAQPETPAKA
ncbi:MAG: efflux RND transporter permease subunit [Oscillospiraceae bacterium]|nr:efflux RND transporter permease subunit [Oscillospiraceae bacterium]